MLYVVHRYWGPGVVRQSHTCIVFYNAKLYVENHYYDLGVVRKPIPLFCGGNRSNPYHLLSDRKPNRSVCTTQRYFYPLNRPLDLWTLTNSSPFLDLVWRCSVVWGRSLVFFWLCSYKVMITERHFVSR